MREQRFVVYVTLLSDGRTTEWYAVTEAGDGRSDLLSDGLCAWSRTSSAVCESLKAWLKQATDEASQSSFRTSK